MNKIGEGEITNQCEKTIQKYTHFEKILQLFSTIALQV